MIPCIPSLKNLIFSSCARPSACFQEALASHSIPQELEEEIVRIQKAWDCYLVMQKVVEKEYDREAQLVCGAFANSLPLVTMCLHGFSPFSRREEESDDSSEETFQEELWKCYQWGDRVNQGKGLGTAVLIAAQRGHAGAVSLLLGSKEAYQIPSDGQFGIGGSLWIASKEGKTEAVLALLGSEHACRILAEGEEGLGSALCIAASWGHAKIVSLILNSLEAHRILSDGEEGLGAALWYAVDREGNEEVVSLLLNSSHAGRISTNEMERARCHALLKAHKSVADLLTKAMAWRLLENESADIA